MLAIDRHKRLIIKTLFSLLFTLLLFQTYPTMSQADDHYDGPYTYTVSTDNKATITRYAGSGGAIAIPDKFVDSTNEYPVVAIGSQAFINKSSITTLSIPEGVTAIGDLAFYGCGALTSVTLPGTLTSIGSYAFAYDYQLANVTIPANVESIGESAFGCCFALTAFNVDSANGAFATDDGVLYDHSKTRLIAYPCGKTGSSFAVPDGVTSIEGGAFLGNRHLSTWAFPGSLRTIGDSAFVNCFNLATISLPNSVTTIGEMLFENCSNLTSVTLPNRITSIGVHAFNNCPLLTNVDIPDSVTRIGWGAFYKCSRLTSITIPNGVTVIDDSTFFGCTNLKNVTLPDNVTTIGKDAFKNCSRLPSVTLPSRLSSIGSNAFAGCTALSTVKFTGNAPSTGAGAFANCNADFKVYYPSDASGYSSYGYTTVPCYRVYYDGNANSGGSAPADSHIYQPGEQPTVLGNTGVLVKRGYTFDGWNTQADGRGDHYGAGDTLTVSSANLRLFAQWTGHAPTDIHLTSDSINENQPPNAMVGAFSADDTDESDSDSAVTFTYELVSGYGDNHCFSVDTNLLKTVAPFDYETKNSYDIRVRATDLANLSSEKSFTVTVNNVVEPNEVSGQVKSGFEDTPLPFTVTDFVYGNADIHLLDHIQLVSLPAHGVLSLNDSAVTVADRVYKSDLNHLVFTPDHDWYGLTSLSWQGSDGSDTTGPFLLSLVIAPVNDAPVAADGTVTTTSGTAASGMLAATDVDGDPLTYPIVAQGSKGTVHITGGAVNAYTYTANPGATGTDAFTFQASDGQADSNIATVHVTILPSTNADLSSLSLSAGTLSPAFAANITNYSTGVDYGVTQLTVSATPSDPCASVSGFTVSNAVYSQEVTLNIGNNVLPIVVTAQDGISQKTYTLTLTRSPKSGGGGGHSSSPSPTAASESSKTVSSHASATVSYGDLAGVEIPAGAVAETVQIRIIQVDAPSLIPADNNLVSAIFEFLKDTEGKFEKPVIITLKFDPSAIGKEQTPAICYYDEKEKTWVAVGGTVDGDRISVAVDHFTKFAVLATTVKPAPAVESPGGAIADIANHWAKESIEALLAKKAISGYPDGDFRPDNRITRAEFAAIIVKAFHLQQKSGKSFNDTADHWANPFVTTANADGILNGYDNDCFGPDEPITREQMAVMVVKAAKLQAATDPARFADDGKISSWAKNSINTAVKNNLISGYPDGAFQPQGNATRAEAAALIVKALQIAKS
ncbi:leucine-rich repeat protein [Heliobacterium gestii]|uniref:Leucine-rich repeat protein n=1 Tax=Heliomicrobium gestii TaxID=2699 RepID=A0A845LBD7_HELGE|nr:leucine-rich repeat protein [Heliomicrobium gestii]MBM7867469.1 putative repeat protein (TIGR02543 family) [Heliomicrobium gestii]MZP43982.1 leucine-rich repeat protein [Heliomicrobium gestii]